MGNNACLTTITNIDGSLGYLNFRNTLNLGGVMQLYRLRFGAYM
jgi:hypothetical protein